MGLELVNVGVFAAWVGWPVFAQKPVDLPPSEIRPECESGLLLYCMSDMLASDGLFANSEHDFVIAGYDRATNGLRMTWAGDTNSYYKIWECHDLMTQVWAMTNMTLGADAQMAWIIPPPADDSYCHFYRVVPAAITNSLDEDGDGMDDVWELRNGLNPVLADGAQDADTDGLSNFQEFKGGSFPTLYDSNTNGVPDGWDRYNATIIPGDVNGDGVLSSADLTALDNILAPGAYHVTPVTFAQANLNNDGVLDELDRQGLQDLLDGRPPLFILNPKVN